MQRQQFDYVIVGGGSTGCLLASRLSEQKNISVCLLEAKEADDSIFIKLTQKDGERCHAELASIPANLHRENLTVMSRAQITAIEFDCEHMANISIKRDGNLIQLHANKEVIVSSGTYFSMQLNALSGRKVTPSTTVNTALHTDSIVDTAHKSLELDAPIAMLHDDNELSPDSKQVTQANLS